MKSEYRELFRLERIRYKCEQPTVEGFLFFCRYFFRITEGVKFKLNDHHEEIAEYLLKCWRHEINRLLINIPPRYSKTEMVIIMFISWCMMMNTRCKFIHLSYSDELALDNSSRVMELIESEEFQQLWPIKFKKDSRAKGLWRTEDGGGLKAGAAGGPVTGFGAGVGVDETEDATQFYGAMLIDDPLKPDDEESEPVRKKTNRRLNATIKSRLNSPHTPIIMIMQRLHDDDPSGFVLNGGTGEEWTHLKIPVIRPDGSPLWPFRHGVKELVAIQIADKRTWNGQYMQEPIPEEGEFFRMDQARWYKTVPANLNCYGGSDYAVTDGAGDYTEHGVFGVCPDGNIYVIDWWSGQTKADVWVEEQIDLIAKYKPQWWGGETGPIKSAVEPWLTKRMRERRTYVPLKWVTHTTPNYKVAGARTLQGMWEAGRVYLPEGKEWAQDLLRQLTRFPLGTLDDKVDAFTIFARLIAKVWEKHPPKPKEEPPPVTDSPLILENFAPKKRKDAW